MTEKNVHIGGCDCGVVQIELKLTRPIEDYVARVCECSFCSQHSPRYVSDPKGLLSISSSDWGLVTKHQFGFQTADFLICSKCKVFVAATCQIESQSYAVTNIKALNDGPNDDMQTKLVDFDSETVEDRLLRRKSTWTPTILS